MTLVTPGQSRAQFLLRAMPLVFVLIWSTGFIVARYGMPFAPPMKFLATRYVLSIACFVLWVLLARVQWPVGRAQWFHLSITGCLMHAGYLGGVWAAVKAGMGPGLAALIVGLQPVLTALWSSYTGLAVTRQQWMGLILGFTGLALVVSRQFGDGADLARINLSLALACGALLSITTGTLYQKRFVATCDVRSASLVQLLAAFAVTFPLACLESEDMVWTAQLTGAMAWSVLALTLGGSSLLYMLLQRGAATSVTSLLYMVPPCTALMAWVLFAEPVTLTTVAGTALTALGVGFVLRAAPLQQSRS
jgi:drug/metabolite transporter (DMT)-like permease